MSPFNLNQLFEQFCKEKEYVKNSSPHTILFYKASFGRAMSKPLIENLRGFGGPCAPVNSGVRWHLFSNGVQMYKRMLAIYGAAILAIAVALFLIPRLPLYISLIREWLEPNPAPVFVN